MTAPEAEALWAELEARLAQRIRSLLASDWPSTAFGEDAEDKRIAGPAGLRWRLRLDCLETVTLISPSGAEYGSARLSDAGGLAALTDQASRDVARSLLASLSDAVIPLLSLGVSGETLAADVLRVWKEIVAEGVHDS